MSVVLYLSQAKCGAGLAGRQWLRALEVAPTPGGGHQVISDSPPLLQWLPALDSEARLPYTQFLAKPTPAGHHIRPFEVRLHQRGQKTSTPADKSHPTSE